MKKLLLIAVLLFPTSNIHAKEYSTLVDPTAYGVQSFKCNEKFYYTNEILPRIHGCETQNISFGSSAETAKLIRVYYDWKKLPNGNQTPKEKTFIELSNEDLYQINDTSFIDSPQTNEFFNKSIGMKNIPKHETNITLERFSNIHFERYNNTFCVNYFLKYPFLGKFGWCQGDTLIMGEASYLPNEMTLAHAAILAQNYIYDNKIDILGNRLFSNKTISALNAKNNFLYYAFAAPASKNNNAKYFIIRVYFNEKVTVEARFEKPSSPNEL